MRNGWEDKSRGEKLAAVLYPNLTSESTRAEMAERAKSERKRAPTAGKLLPDHTRGPVSPLDGRMR
jgi:hypothetical protein